MGGLHAASLRHGADRPFPRRARLPPDLVIHATTMPLLGHPPWVRVVRSVGVPFCAVTGARGERQRPGAPQVCVRPGLRGVTKVPLPCTVTMIPRSRSTAIACRTVV